ncbi:MAG: hypothetical protein H6722_00415 [Sandaracinus sp.]|nr:hypothetical protein [Sandaracinus sp.]
MSAPSPRFDPGIRPRRGSRSPRFSNRFVATSLVALAAATVHAALPPGYGGELRLPAPTALAAPSPNDATPFGALVAAAVFDGLYTLADDGCVVPSLAQGPVTAREDGTLVVTLRENVRRHDRRTLRALDVARALRRASREQPHWLAGFAFDGPELDVGHEGERTLLFAPPATSFPAPTETLARRLAAAPLAIDLGRGIGTGPYRASLRGNVLELRSFRAAARGAAYVDVIRFDPPRTRDDEIRTFELGQLDASWQGASLYGQRDSNARSHAFPHDTAVLLVPRGAFATSTETLNAAVDRRRFARAGLRPNDRLAEGLARASLAHRGPLPRAARMIVRAGNAFELTLAAALAARLDELNVRLTVVEVAPERFERERASADLSLAYAVPALPGADARVASAIYAATGDANAAGRVLDAPPADVVSASSSLPAIVLGHLDRTLHHREPLRGVAHDPLGRLRLERLHLPRNPSAASSEDE